MDKSTKLPQLIGMTKLSINALQGNGGMVPKFEYLFKGL